MKPDSMKLDSVDAVVGACVSRLPRAGWRFKQVSNLVGFTHPGVQFHRDPVVALCCVLKSMRPSKIEKLATVLPPFSAPFSDGAFSLA
jgi:hypothetical protein